VKRVFWGLVGLGAGVVVGVAVVRWANKTKERYAPPALAREAGAAAASFFDRLRDAIETGRDEMARAEDEIRAELGLPNA
jgi:histidinol-phosphate/aromatic aminotransferase/cobyric acid decarboxylase-like protein